MALKTSMPLILLVAVVLLVALLPTVAQSQLAPSPTSKPTAAPAVKPATRKPTNILTIKPTAAPVTRMPATKTPTSTPTAQVHPSNAPTPTPTFVSTKVPTAQPSNAPTPAPTTVVPTSLPAKVPTAQPSSAPTAVTLAPSAMQTPSPTRLPTRLPTFSPSQVPTLAPTAKAITTRPTRAPTSQPTGAYCGSATNILLRDMTTGDNVNGSVNALSSDFCGYILPIGPGRWYKYTSLLSGPVSVTTSPPSSGQPIKDSVLSVITNPTCSNPTCVTYSDKYGSTATPYATVLFTATAGMTYYILVTGFRSINVGSFGIYIDTRPALSNVTQLAGGKFHTCALLSDGSGKCWGYNFAGQLGDFTYVDSLKPVSVAGLHTGTAITAGSRQTCALLSDGSVNCWGDNWGQNGGYQFAVISLGGPATAVTAGYGHACAVLSGGSVKCWGSNIFGQLGDGSTTDSLTRPVSVISLGGAAKTVTAGEWHTCAVLIGGSVKCWGYNSYGELGDGTTTDSSTPVSVISLGGAITAVAGSVHTCALIIDGSVKCWGSKYLGQLGDGTYAGDVGTPVSVASLGGATTALATGYSHSCAVLSGRSVNCWGFNDLGQLGDGTTTSSSTHVSVASLGGAATALAAGISHSCALLSDGSVKCWGANYNGELGGGTTIDHSTPVSVIAF